MPRTIIDPVKLLDILKKDIQELENRKTRLIRETDKAQKEANEVSDKLASFKKAFSAKEKALIEKYEKKEAELDRKIAEQNGRLAEVSSKEGELKKAVALNKKAEKIHNTNADLARAEQDKCIKVNLILDDIVKVIKTKLG